MPLQAWVGICGFAVVLAAAVAYPSAIAGQPAPNPCAVPDALLAAGEKGPARTEYLRLLRRDPTTECASRGLQTINAPSAPKAKVPCEPADAAFDRGDLDAAASGYSEVGTDAKCAETGLAAVHEVRRLCAQGQVDLDLRRRDDAMAAFKSALEKNPNADCAQEGIQESDRFWILRAIVWTVGATPDLLVGAGLLFAIFFLLLLTAYIPGVYAVLSRAPLARGVLSARLSLAPLDDKATKLDVGTAMAAQIKERLQHFREEALRGRQPDYELDIGSAGEEFVDLVSSDSGLQDALGKARELSEQTKTIGAIVGLLQAALPIPKLVVTGVLGPPDRNGVASTLSLDHNGRLEAAATLSGPALDHDPTASDYMRVAQPCAVWVQYEVARVLTRGQIEPDAAESYVHVREGLDRYLAGQEDAARVAYERAVLLNPQNWAAHVNLAVLEARLSGNFSRSIQIGEEAWEEMRTIGSPT